MFSSQDSSQAEETPAICTIRCWTRCCVGWRSLFGGHAVILSATKNQVASNKHECPNCRDGRVHRGVWAEFRYLTASLVLYLAEQSLVLSLIMENKLFSFDKTAQGYLIMNLYFRAQYSIPVMGFVGRKDLHAPVVSSCSLSSIDAGSATIGDTELRMALHVERGKVRQILRNFRAAR